MAGRKAGVTAEHNGEIFEDEAEDLGGLAEVRGHVDEAVHQGGQQRHQQLPRGGVLTLQKNLEIPLGFFPTP